MSFRIEEKIVLTPFERDALLKKLHDRGMETLYPSRQIHSVYFEAPGRRMFCDSEEGVLPRKKVRLRRYPQDPRSRWALETKISSVEGRFKTVTRPTEAEVTDMLRFGLLDRQYGMIQPMLTVDYRRHYYTLRGLRVTFDSDIAYGLHDGRDRAAEPWTVCEIKAPAETSLDDLARLIDVPRRRFSKFSNGILRLGNLMAA